MATAKIRTITQLLEAIDNEMGWRKKELSYLKTAVTKNSSGAQATYIRAAISLLYAHWEGFVVAALRSYVSYVQMQRLKLQQLTPSMRVGGVLSKLRLLESSPTSLNRARLLMEYDDALGKIAELKPDKLVDAESNLNSRRFIGLVASAGIDTSSLETACHFLDEALLAKRNAICHGESLNVDREAYESLQDQVLDLMERVKTEVINGASTSAYRL